MLYHVMKQNLLLTISILLFSSFALSNSDCKNEQEVHPVFAAIDGGDKDTILTQLKNIGDPYHEETLHLNQSSSYGEYGACYRYDPVKYAAVTAPLETKMIVIDYAKEFGVIHLYISDLMAIAATMQYRNFIEYLLTLSPDQEALDRGLYFALNGKERYGQKERDYRLAEFLLSQGAQFSQSESLYFEACRSKDERLGFWLIDKEASAAKGKVNGGGNSAVMECIYKGVRNDLIIAMLENGADANYITESDIASVLSAVASKGDPELINYVLDNVTDEAVQRVQSSGFTALYNYVSRSGNLDISIVRKFLTKGSNPLQELERGGVQKDSPTNGSSAYSLAVFDQNQELLNLYEEFISKDELQKISNKEFTFAATVLSAQVKGQTLEVVVSHRECENGEVTLVSSGYFNQLYYREDGTKFRIRRAQHKAGAGVTRCSDKVVETTITQSLEELHWTGRYAPNYAYILSDSGHLYNDRDTAKTIHFTLD